MENNNAQSVNIPRRQSPQQVPTGINMPNEVRAALNNNVVKVPEKQKYPSEPINLPSEGFFYASENSLSSGMVDIKYMTAMEEDILTSQNLIKKGIVLDRLLENLILTPGVNINDLLIGDKNAIFLAARILAYGSNYGPLKVKCSSCGEENKTEFDLSKVENKDIKTEGLTRGINSFPYTFPFSKRNITFKFLTHGDEKEVDNEVKSTAKFSKSGIGTDLTTRLKKIITSIDGKSDLESIRQFVERDLLSKDNIEFRKHMREMLPDVDMTFNFNCQVCNYEERMSVPIAAQFFWPDSSG